MRNCSLGAPAGRTGARLVAAERSGDRGAKGLEAKLTEEMNEWVTITSDGKQRRVRKRRIIIKALAAKAAKGNVAAADRLISLIISAEGLEDQRRAEKKLGTTDQQTPTR